MARQNKRKAIVFVSLIGVLTFTSALLLAIAPAPLRPEMSATLFNQASAGVGMDLVFQTDRPITKGRWTSILVRYSGTKSGNSHTIADPKHGATDHFIICNGNGGADGEIQINSRWASQLSALPPAGASAIDPRCLLICVVGDARVAQTTVRQSAHLNALLAALLHELNIPANQVWSIGADNKPVTIFR